MMYWAISLDNFSEEVFHHLERHQDGKAGHYAVYHGTKEQAIQKCLAALRPLIERMIYQSDDYGYELQRKSSG